MSYLVRQLEKAFEWSNDPMLNDAAEEITALSARVAELEAERDALAGDKINLRSELIYVEARAEAAEALLSEAVKAGMVEGAEVIDRVGPRITGDTARALASDSETIARIVAKLKDNRG